MRRSASGGLGLLPPPLAGEGWGGGERVHMNRFECPLDLYSITPPHPPPPPRGGAGGPAHGGTNLQKKKPNPFIIYHSPPPATPSDLFAFLDRLGIAHATVTHPPLFTVEQSQQLRGTISGGHT